MLSFLPLAPLHIWERQKLTVLPAFPNHTRYACSLKEIQYIEAKTSTKLINMPQGGSWMARSVEDATQSREFEPPGPTWGMGPTKKKKTQKMFQTGAV